MAPLIRSWDELCSMSSCHASDSTESQRAKVFQFLDEITELNAGTDLDSILQAYKEEPCRRDKIVAHLKTVYRLGDDAIEPLLALQQKLQELEPIEPEGEDQSHGGKQCITMALFNFKGGVGKTTMTTNVAASLAKRGFRVGVVDADVQGNTTGYFCGAASELGKAEEQGAHEELEEDLNRSLNHDLPNGVTVPDLDAELELIPMLHDKLSVVGCKMQAGFEDAHRDFRDDFYKMMPVELPGAVLYLLGGGPELAQIDESFSPKLQRDYHLKSNEGMLVGSFRVLLKRLAMNNALDVILVDVGPSSSLFNAWLVTSCDYILPPAFADKFSALSIRDFVHTVIPSFRDKQAHWLRSMWLNDKEAIRDNKDYLFNPITIVLPFMLGKIAVIKSSGSTTVTNACAKWVFAIQETLNKADHDKTKVDDRRSLVHGTLLLQDYKMYAEKYYCTFIKELQSEVPIAQQWRIPAVCLQSKHLTKLGGANSRLAYIRGRYDTLSTFLLKE